MNPQTNKERAEELGRANSNAPAGHTPAHTPGAVNAAQIITEGDYDSPKRYRTVYGMKTCQGVADIIDRETHAPDMLEALEYARSFIEANAWRFPKSIKHADTFRLNVTRAAIGKALHRATGGTAP